MNAPSPATQAPELLREAATAAKRSSLQRLVSPRSNVDAASHRELERGAGAELPRFHAEGVTLYHCDCMELMRRMPDKSFDLAIVDPPYGRGEDGGTNRCHGVKQRNGKVMLCMDGGYAAKKWDRTPPPLEYFAELRRVSVHQIIWGVNYYEAVLPGGRIIWDKVNDGADQSGAEIAYNSMNQRVDVVRYMWRGMMQGVSVRQGTVQQGNKALNEKRIHPTQKPVKLYDWLLATYAKPGQRILDTHLGSGSLAISARNYGCTLTASEIDGDYIAAAIDRITKDFAQGMLFGGGGGLESDVCGSAEKGTNHVIPEK